MVIRHEHDLLCKIIEMKFQSDVFRFRFIFKCVHILLYFLKVTSLNIYNGLFKLQKNSEKNLKENTKMKKWKNKNHDLYYFELAITTNICKL